MSVGDQASLLFQGLRVLRGGSQVRGVQHGAVGAAPGSQHADAIPRGGPLVEMPRDVAEVVSEVLAEYLQPIRHQLHRRAIPGDGACQFRAVTVQCPAYGYGGHARLRQEAVDHVRAHRHLYRHNFVGADQNDQLAAWLGRMQRLGTWGDNLTLIACARILGRPIAVWRKDSDQAPTIILPLQYDEQNPPDPIYVELDETHPGVKHVLLSFINYA